MMPTILDAFDAQGRRSGDAVFCHFLKNRKVETITYGGLYREACRYARLFQSRGLAAGDVVLIILEHTPDLYYAFMGAMLGGWVPSFMPFPTRKQDPRLYWESHRALFRLIQAGAVLTYPENLALLRAQIPDLPLQAMTPQDAAGLPPHFSGAAADPDSIAFLQHSSGTTGLKKGVALSHRAVLDQIASYSDRLQLSGADRIASWLPLYHDMGLIACFMLPLVTGTPLVQMDPFEWVVSPRMLLDAIGQYRATLCWQPNFAFHHLCRTVKAGQSLELGSVRAWINCSEPCKAATFNLFANQFGPVGVDLSRLQVCYAMAETVFAVTQTGLGAPVNAWAADGPVPDQSEGSWLSTGTALASLRFKICGSQGQVLPDGQIGEIAVAGDCLFSGYFKRPEETRVKLRDGWYYTGDLGFTVQNELVVTGRKHDLIIVHGRNYYAHELEFLVNEVPGVKPGRAVAAGCFQPGVGSEEVVVIAESERLGPAAESLAADIKQHLLDTSGLLPFDVRIVRPGWLIKTTSGKISRSANLQKYLAGDTVQEGVR